MATISEALAIAIQRHREGRRQEAEQIYRQILQADPNQVAAIHLLGVLAHQAGKHELAVEYIDRAISLKEDEACFHTNLANVYRALHRIPEAVASGRRALELSPDSAEAHYNLGNVLMAHPAPDEAIACYRRALELAPAFAEAHANLGGAFKEQGRLEEALPCFRRALELKPDLAEAMNNLGFVLKSQGEIDEAIAWFRRALALMPSSSVAQLNLGHAFASQGKLEDAAACYRRALELQPEFADARESLGILLAEMGKPEEAIACFRRALTLDPGCAWVHNNLGNALRDQAQPEAAAASFRRALELEPNYPEAHVNLGNALRDQGKPEAAIACFRRGLELKPDFPGARHNLAITLLQLGQFEEGWANYESRRALLPARNFPAPRWNQLPATGQTMFVHCEQGFGDSLHFLRYASLAAERTGARRVILECQPELARLLRQSAPDEMEVIPRGEGENATLPAFDWHLPLLSLPLAFGIFEPLPTSPAYLWADPELRATWRGRLGPPVHLRVGLVWAGNRERPVLRLRSIESEKLLPLLSLPGIECYNLVVNADPGEVQPLTRAGLIDLTSSIDDFADTAALMAELDLIISVDTAAAHLAGALGRPVWTLLKFVADWRWGLEGETTPWYPTMRLFRQPAAGDWDAVIQTVAAELRGLKPGFAPPPPGSLLH